MVEQNEVVDFIERVLQEEDLVGDGSIFYFLFIIFGKYVDLKSIMIDMVCVYVIVIY